MELFEDNHDAWSGMPEFVQEKKTEFHKVIIRVDNESDLEALSQALGQKITPKTKSAWYPFRSHWREEKAVWVDDKE